MNNYCVYVTAEGKVDCKNGKPTLEEMQKFVEGYIEPVSIRYAGRKCRMVCNEEGLIKNLPVNTLATQLYKEQGGEVIVGNVIILVGYRI